LQILLFIFYSLLLFQAAFLREAGKNEDKNDQYKMAQFRPQRFNGWFSDALKTSAQ